MAWIKRMLAFGGVGTVVAYYSPWVHSTIRTWEVESFMGRNWEMIKMREDQLRTSRWLVRPVKSIWWNASRSRLNYYLFGADTMRPVGSDLPHGGEVVEEWIEYQKKARIRPLGPWFDAFSDPRSLAILDEYSKTSPALMADRLEKAPDRHYKTSYGGATLPEGKPRGASIASFLFECDGFAPFYDKQRQKLSGQWEEIETTVEDPLTREAIKSTLNAFKLYWAEQLEEYLPFIACRPKEKQKLANYLIQMMSNQESEFELGKMMYQRDGFKKVLLAAGVNMTYE